MVKTVIQYVLSRLHHIGIKDVFGVAGDYAFPIDDAVCADQRFRWIGSCNELNAAYAADGYARIHGIAALCTTFGVGELSAINGIAGAYAEYLPIFHLVGMPSSKMQASHRLVHHSLGNGEFNLFYKMTDSVVCARAIMTPDNCVGETERLITAALYHRRPVYMAFPSDYANMPVIGKAEPVAKPSTNKNSLNQAVDAIIASVSMSKTACIIPGIVVSRYNLSKQTTAVVDASGLPFTTMFMDKCVLDERHPNYIGMYNGQLMNEPVRVFVEEKCDCVLGIGAMMTDFNTGIFTAKKDCAKSINIMQNSVRVGHATYDHIEMEDILAELARKISRKDNQEAAPKACGLGEPVGESNSKITVDYLYPRWQQMLKPDDILIAETGTTSMGMLFAQMPTRATFQNQSLWGSIGWATPAAFGAALSAPGRRTILITGEGSHQLTAQEISQFYRFDLKPIIFVLNNGGYLIERLLCKDPNIYYNNLAHWQYCELPRALGCDGWFTARVTTCGELDEAIKTAESFCSGSYIEVITDKRAASALALKFHEYIDNLHTE